MHSYLEIISFLLSMIVIAGIFLILRICLSIYDKVVLIQLDPEFPLCATSLAILPTLWINQ